MVKLVSATARPPARDPLVRDGEMAQSWQAFFAKISDDLATSSAIGDIKQSAAPDLGPRWLRCDGQDVEIVRYAKLYDLIGAQSEPGTAPGTFKLFQGTVTTVAGDPARVVTRTFIRAL